MSKKSKRKAKKPKIGKAGRKDRRLKKKAARLWDRIVGIAVVVPEAPAVDEDFWLKPDRRPASK